MHEIRLRALDDPRSVTNISIISPERSSVVKERTVPRLIARTSADEELVLTATI
jgi:hypothetical protein